MTENRDSSPLIAGLLAYWLEENFPDLPDDRCPDCYCSPLELEEDSGGLFCKSCGALLKVLNVQQTEIGSVNPLR